MREHVEPISKPSQTVDIKTSQPAILRWLSRMIGMVVMFVACLFICHAVGMISIDLGHFSP